MIPKLGQIVPVELREIWKNEASDFTPWLAHEENIAALGNALGLELEVAKQEENVGQFRLDIRCKESESGKIVLIENQIEDTDHGHLGQILTYAAGVDASTIIWIAKKFTEEHRAALDWLNEKLEGAPVFFGVEIELWRIGNSEPAPKFNIVSKPNGWSKKVRRAVNIAEMTDVERVRFDYWTRLNEYLKSSGSTLQLRGAGQVNSDRFFRLKSPIRGFYFGFQTSARDKWISVYLSSRSADKIAMLRGVSLQRKQDFAKEMSANVDWDSGEDDGVESWVTVSRDDDPTTTQDWPRQHQWLKETAEKIARILPKYLAEVEISS